MKRKPKYQQRIVKGKPVSLAPCRVEMTTENRPQPNINHACTRE